MTDILIKILAGVLGTVGFALIFRLHPRLLPYVIADSFITCCVYFAVMHFIGGDFISNALAALTAAVLADVFARIKKAPSTVFLLTSCITLVPGGSLYYSMSNLIAQDYSLAFSYLLTTLKVGIGIGGGIIAASLFRYVIASIRKKKYLSENKRMEKQA